MNTAVITGASRGIGRATALAFLAAGWRVIGTYHRREADIAHPDFSQVVLDLSEPASIAAAAEEIVRRAPHIHALINNAAVLLDYASASAVADLVRDTLEVNVVGTIDVTERLLAHMKSGAHIVNVDSNIGSFVHPVEEDSAVGYRISKAALNMYTRTLARRIAPQGILVSSLDPGWVDTDMGRAGGDVPDRTPEEPGAEIFTLVASVHDIALSGQFWRFGEVRPW